MDEAVLALQVEGAPARSAAVAAASVAGVSNAGQEASAAIGIGGIVCGTLELLLGVRDPRTARAMRRAGFGEGDERQGWSRVLAAAGAMAEHEKALVLEKVAALLGRDRLALSELRRESAARLIHLLRSSQPALADKAMRALRLHAD